MSCGWRWPPPRAVTLAVLVLRSGESPGIEIERGGPPPGIDEVRVHAAGALAGQPAAGPAHRGDNNRSLVLSVHGDVTLRSGGERL